MAQLKILKRAGKYLVGEIYNDIPAWYEKYLLENGYAIVAKKAVKKAPKNKAIEKTPKNKNEFIGNKDMK